MMRQINPICLGMLALMLSACDQSPSTVRPEALTHTVQTAEETETKKWSSRIKNHYFEKDSVSTWGGFSSDPKIAGGSSISEQGVLSQPMKAFIKSLWLQLKAKGFSGYDESVLDGKALYSESGMPHGYRYAFRDLPPNEQQFHSQLIQNIFWTEHTHYLSLGTIYESLRGLKFNDQFVVKVKDETQRVFSYTDQRGNSITNAKQLYVLSNEWRDAESGYVYELPDIQSTDTIIPETQLKEWNQIFVDEFKRDPFFRQFFEPAAVSDGSGSVSLSGARKGSTGIDAVAFNVNGVSGSKVDLGLPMYVQLKGSVDHGKSTNLTTGTVAYKLGNTWLEPSNPMQTVVLGLVRTVVRWKPLLWRLTALGRSSSKVSWDLSLPPMFALRIGLGYVRK
jgi:hypothetical protein